MSGAGSRQQFDLSSTCREAHEGKARYTAEDRPVPKDVKTANSDGPADQSVMRFR
jgi:hypothetical protein